MQSCRRTEVGVLKSGFTSAHEEKKEPDGF